MILSRVSSADVQGGRPLVLGGGGGCGDSRENEVEARRERRSDGSCAEGGAECPDCNSPEVMESRADGCMSAACGGCTRLAASHLQSCTYAWLTRGVCVWGCVPDVAGHARRALRLQRPRHHAGEGGGGGEDGDEGGGEGGDEEGARMGVRVLCTRGAAWGWDRASGVRAGVPTERAAARALPAAPPPVARAVQSPTDYPGRLPHPVLRFAFASTPPPDSPTSPGALHTDWLPPACTQLFATGPPRQPVPPPHPPTPPEHRVQHAGVLLELRPPPAARPLLQGHGRGAGDVSLVGLEVQVRGEAEGRG